MKWFYAHYVLPCSYRNRPWVIHIKHILVCSVRTLWWLTILQFVNRAITPNKKGVDEFDDGCNFSKGVYKADWELCSVTHRPCPALLTSITPDASERPLISDNDMCFISATNMFIRIGWEIIDAIPDRIIIIITYSANFFIKYHTPHIIFKFIANGCQFQ